MPLHPYTTTRDISTRGDRDHDLEDIIPVNKSGHKPCHSTAKDLAKKGTEKGIDLGKKGIEKSVELGTKGYEGAKESAQKGYEKGKKKE